MTNDRLATASSRFRPEDAVMDHAQGEAASARGSDLDVGRLPVHKSEEYGTAAKHYGLLWWNNGDGRVAGVPR